MPVDFSKYTDLFGIIADAIAALVAAGEDPEKVRARVIAYLATQGHDKTDDLTAEILKHYEGGA